ncbi:MAG: hypothetical protein R6W73_00440 [Candidatus Saliniplasma sp.]
MKEKKVRGVVMEAYFNSIKRQFGEKGVRKCAEYAGISPDDIKSKMWYPAEYHAKIHTWIGENKGAEYVTTAGKYGIKNMGFLSYLARFISIKTLLKKAPKSHRDAYNFGSMSIVKDEEKKEALVKLKGVIIDEYSCHGWKGVFVGGLEATKTKGKVKIIDHPEKGEDDCFLKIQWG